MALANPQVQHAARAPGYVALTGNPNCGKTTIFNALTGLRAKIGNYAGVTVERKEGRLRGAPEDRNLIVLDLPGTYSLSPKSMDERISRDVLFGRLSEVPAPSVVVVVVDASNLQRNLYYASQVIELGYPAIIALNMVDVATENGHQVNVDKLSETLSVPVVPMVASKGVGVAELRKAILELNGAQPPVPPSVSRFTTPDALEEEISGLARPLQADDPEDARPLRAVAMLLLSDDKALLDEEMGYPEAVRQAVRAARERLKTKGLDWQSAIIEARYAWVAEVCRNSVTETAAVNETFSDRLDRVLTHRFWGLFIFVGLMALVFQCIFSFAQIPMDLIAQNIDALGGWVERIMPPGALADLAVNGVIGGVGAVVVFLPQILLLFFFICLLEDTGYMARAAFIMDRLMSKVGLHGKSFIPMLSSFACAIPGIMATRTIESPKDRLVTILIAPLMSCSARLPVYTVLIAACIPAGTVFGFLRLSGLTLLGAYLLGVVAALVMAWIFKKTLLKTTTPLLIIELPPYKRPVFTAVLRHMWDRGRLFLTQAGTVILGINMILWFLAYYPKNAPLEQDYAQRKFAAITNAYPAIRSPEEAAARAAELENLLANSAAAPGDPAAQKAWKAIQDLETGKAAARIHNSFAGRIGRLIEPAIAPLGFDWKIGIGLLSSFAAREVFVSSMSIVYNVGQAEDDDATSAGLAKVLQAQKRPDGSPVFSTLTGISLIVFYVFALQCASTVAVVRRETNSWKWPVFQWLYLGALAWLASFVVYQGGKALGWG